MAKIIYAVAGEGFGHSSRAHLIGQKLIESGHQLMFAGSQKSLAYLKRYFNENVKEVFGLFFVYDKGYVQPFKTFLKNVSKLPQAIKVNKKLFRECFRPFNPDLIITDFEPFSAWWAWKNNIPYISIDNEHILTLGVLKHKIKNLPSRITATTTTKCYYTGAAFYIVFSFFDTRLKSRSAILAPPVIRNEVTRLTPVNGKEILVYSTMGKGLEKLLNLLQKFENLKFNIYGFNKDEKHGNCTLKKPSTENFLKDLAECKGVIASAGFSLISECMYLKKRLLALPVAGQYEQIINGFYLEELGLGICAKKLTEDSLERFVTEAEKPISKDKRILWPDNNKFFEILQSTLAKLSIPIRAS